MADRSYKATATGKRRPPRERARVMRIDAGHRVAVQPHFSAAGNADDPKR